MLIKLSIEYDYYLFFTRISINDIDASSIELTMESTFDNI